jgi:hypothetical protein
MSITSIKTLFCSHRQQMGVNPCLSSLQPKSKRYTYASSMHGKQMIKIGLYISRNLCHQAREQQDMDKKPITNFGWACISCYRSSDLHICCLSASHMIFCPGQDCIVAIMGVPHVFHRYINCRVLDKCLFPS